VSFLWHIRIRRAFCAALLTSLHFYVLFVSLFFFSSLRYPPAKPLTYSQCIYVLHGHTATIRAIRVLPNRPIAITGSRDSTLRVWDVRIGVCLRVLEGHASGVRCLDVSGGRVVSGSYDSTCRVWNIDTGECLHVLQGHFQQIYSVAFDGVRIASGGLDTTVRVWDAETG